jgi:hypothetical protein
LANVKRRSAPAAIVAAFVAFAVFAGSADARTIRVKWTDTQPWGGGHVVYRTTKIWIHGDRFSVSVSVTNRSKYEIRFFRGASYNPPFSMPPGFGIAWHAPLKPGVIQSNGLRSVAATTYSPGVPRKLGIRLGVGKTLNLTFSGRSPLLRAHRTWWVTFGLVVPWKGKHALSASAVTGPHGSSWFSEKTFST